jgi:Protein adenylyltransferase SelO
MTAPLYESALSFLANDAQIEMLFGTNSGHVPVLLRRADEARILWINEKALQQDPRCAGHPTSPCEYANHILERCAFVAAADMPHAKADRDIIGFADRYGGRGIGRNGGSGRSAVVNGYHVKGIGRTPLIGAQTDFAHASGGAYLEECVREAIYSEVVARTFPRAAVPTLAIIDTGLVQIWDTENGPKTERRTLLVRPCFVRPAHFQRAIGYNSANAKEGVEDRKRVEMFFMHAAAMFGKDELCETFNVFGERWAHQMAHSFIFRLPHGSNTTSNIAFDGSLVDFGAMTAVPSWANVITMLRAQPFGSQFGVIARAVQDLSYYAGRYLDPKFAEADAIKQRVGTAKMHYQKSLIHDALQFCNVPRISLNAEIDLAHAWSIIEKLILRYQSTKIDFYDELPDTISSWDIATVWNNDVDDHLKPLQRLLFSLTTLTERIEARDLLALQSRPNPSLYRQIAKKSIYDALEVKGEADAATVTAYIGNQIALSLPIFTKA